MHRVEQGRGDAHFCGEEPMSRKFPSRRCFVSHRKAAAALIAASSGLAMLAASDLAYGTTFTFTTAGGDWQDPNNWTPTGFPGVADLAKIRTLTAPALTLNAADMTIGALLNDSSNVINLSNATTGSTNSTLTITGISGMPLIWIDRAVASTVFTIQG